MSKVLGRVTGALDRPRGPDVTLRLQVPLDWLKDGATVEIELPRNLHCAACDGGGCDACGRSGAVSLRSQHEPPELVQVTLPRADRLGESSGAFIVRIPERGGMPSAGSGLPRGHLLLRISAGDAPDAGVARVRRSLLPAARRWGFNAPGVPGEWRVRIVLGVVVLFVAYALWQIARAVQSS